MMEVSLNETETRYYRDLFVCCDVEKTGKIPMLKATELFRSANLTNEVLKEITSIAGIPATSLHINRAQFFSCLKLIAAHQASIHLRQELISANIQLPLPRFSWKENDGAPHTNGGSLNIMPPPPSLPSGDHQDRRSSITHQATPDTALNSDVQSTDSEVEQNESSCGIVESGGHGSSGREMHRRRGGTGSPEAWSTNSDSPTPTNSVAERPWAKENLWHGLLGDEHRQLLGTEEESSDRHSSDDETDLEAIYQITPEQRDYYYKQFKAVQHDPNGLLSGQVARIFFEKSRIPVEELRHIWQLCDVTRDGALSLSEFTAAMHLVVLRRNNILPPKTLPACLHPNVLQHTAHAVPPAPPQEPPEADLLHLNDDDEEDNTENTIISGIINTTATTATNPIAGAAAVVVPSSTEKTVMNLSTLSTSSQDAPPTQWTKFTESPTSNVSSPGPKPVNFDMQRTAQAVVSDPQILHPVPLRVTPVAGALSGANATATSSTTTLATETLNQDINDGAQNINNTNNNNNTARSYSPKQIMQTSTVNTSHHRDSLQQQSSDLRAIQRPQPKKLPNKNIGAIPPPPQREPSIGSASSGPGGDADTANNSSHNNINQQQQTIAIVNSLPQTIIAKKDIQPPLPPPRPHRHGRSNSLDLNKFKIGEITAQASFDLQTSTGFADFTQFSEDGAKSVNEPNAEQHSLPPQQQQQHQQNTTQQQLQQQLPPPTAALPLSRISLQSNQRVSAFEVYRKPNSQSPPLATNQSTTTTTATISTNSQHFIQQTVPHPPPFGAAGAAAIAGAVPINNITTATTIPNADIYEKRVNAITETLRHVSFRADSNITDILRHLREQNGLLLHLCNDLSDELLSVQTRKEELRLKLEAIDSNSGSSSVGGGGTGTGVVVGLSAPPIARTGSSISAPVTANVTGGSGSSGVHSNV